MHVILGALLGAITAALLWDLSIAQAATNFAAAATIFGGGLWAIKAMNRQRP